MISKLHKTLPSLLSLSYILIIPQLFMVMHSKYFGCECVKFHKVSKNVNETKENEYH
jgi:hypothetical protein